MRNSYKYANLDLTGKRHERLVVLRKADHGRSWWVCKCDCGQITFVRSSNLTSGAVKSCGCLKHKPHNKTHGESQSKLYRCWTSMIYRCENPKNHAYRWYGERGIKVCKEWQTYENFKEWVEKTRPNENCTIDRIDTDGDYCPENCRWVDAKDQANNRRTNIVIEYGGKIMNLMQWSEYLGIDYKLIHNRMFKLGWDFEKAISTPVDTKKRNRSK